MNRIPDRNELIRLLDEQADANLTLAERATQLQHENAAIRKHAKIKAHVRRANRAYTTAYRMATIHVSGHLSGRTSCRKIGISERAYHIGKAFLMAARLHNGTRWLTNDPELIDQRLTNQLKVSREIDGVLEARIIQSRRPK